MAVPVEPAQLNVWGSAGTAMAMFFIAVWQAIDAKRAKKEAREGRAKANEHVAEAAVSKQYQEISKAMEADAAEWRARWERTNADWAGRYEAASAQAREQYSQLHKEFEEQRKYWHQKAQADQVLLARCQEDCADLKSSRDFGPVHAEIKAAQLERQEQSRMMAKIFDLLDKLLPIMGRLENKSQQT